MFRHRRLEVAPPQSSAGGTSAFTSTRARDSSSDAHALLRRRLALFGRVTFALSFGFLLIACALDAIAPGGDWLETFTRPVRLLHAAGTLVLGLAWASCRVPLSRRGLEVVDAAATVLACAAFALMPLASLEPRAIYPTLLAVTNTLLTRAVIVPSSARRTAWIAGASSLAVVLGHVADITLGERPFDSLAVDVAYSLTWCAVATTVAAVASRIIYGLRQEVSAARRLGQYTLEERLGEGGMGQVYKARHAMLRRPTAIKLLPPEKAGAENVARFEREVQTTAQLTHPNTIAIYDHGRTAEGIFYYAMEYLPGVTLQELVHQYGPQPPDRVISILRQACGSLAEAHGAGLVHRDVKPANIILCERGGMQDVVKVLDFGLVKELVPGQDLELTAADALHGTPLYLSPEAISEAETVGPQSDLYALGAVGWFLLAGEPVFKGRNVVEVCAHHLHTPPDLPSARLGRPLPLDLEAIVMSCLAKRPSGRPASAAALNSALGACRDAQSWTPERASAWWRDAPPMKEGARRTSKAGPESISDLPTLAIQLRRSDASAGARG